MSCHCPSSSICPSPFMDLPSSLLEHTFASLPLRSVLALSSSCKLLHSLVSSAPFALLHSRSLRNRSPWFFFFGFNFLLPQRNQAFAFDPLLHSWVRLPFTPPPPHNTSSLSAMNGTMFALINAKQSQMCVALSPLKQDWHVIEGSMAVSRKDPLVGVFVEDDLLMAPKLGSCSIVVVGGGYEDTREDDKLAVEVFRGSTGNWERCESMPEKMRGKTLCSAVVGDMFYVADCEGSTVCRLDVKKGVWMECKTEKPKEVTWWQLVGANFSLWAVAASRRAIKLYKILVDPEMEGKLEEMGTMPQELYDHMFEEVEEEEAAVELAVTLRCCGGGDNLLYIYRQSCFREYITCTCNLSNMRWDQMPPLPEPVHRFDKVACLSSCVSLS